MPELPEVHTITTDLKKHLEGAVIKNIRIAGLYKVFPNNKIYLKYAVGQKISEIRRIAKNIIFELESQNYILFHLAMTGQLLIKDPKAKNLKPTNWERIHFILDKNGAEIHLKFCDVRMFGKSILLNKEHLKKVAQKYGPEPLDSNFKPEAFLKRLKSKRTNIKNALLDQSVVSGLGNIYATDALFLAEIHPLTQTKDLTLVQTSKLLETAKQVLNEGILHRGSTLGDKMYVDAFGKSGTHQNYFKIYGKEKCDRCKAKVEFIKINGRGTFFCPNCQISNGQYKLI